MERGEKKRETRRLPEWTGRILYPSLLTLLLFATLLSLYRPVFLLNDDMLIDSILSGSYLEPYPYAYYFSAPLGLLLTGLYRLFPGVAWLGLFYLGCIMACFWAILRRISGRISSWKGKLLAAGMLLAGFAAWFLPYFVFLHYTIIAAILGGTGILLLGLSRERKELVLPILFLLLCYLVRENVFFMAAPFASIIALFLVLRGGRQCLREYLPCGLLFLGLFALLFVWNRSLLLIPQWSHFKEYNDERTQIYDYLGIPEDEEACRYYEGKGLSKEMLAVYQAYDLALLEGDSGQEGLRTILSLGEERVQQKGSLSRLRLALAGYKHRLFHWKEDAPYMALTLCLYGAMLILATGIREYLVCFLLFAYRSAFWVYLLYQGRYPQRVTISLFVLEIGALLTVLFVQGERAEKKRFRRYGKAVLMGLGVAVVLLVAIVQLEAVHKEREALEAVRQSDETLYKYFAENKEYTYYLDVYATVNRCRYALTPQGKIKENYVVLGGWILEHPLYLQRLNGYESMAQAMAEEENGMFVKKEGVGLEPEVLESLVGRELQEAGRLETQTGTYLMYRFVPAPEKE